MVRVGGLGWGGDLVRMGVFQVYVQGDPADKGVVCWGWVSQSAKSKYKIKSSIPFPIMGA